MKYFLDIVPPPTFSSLVSNFQREFPENKLPDMVEPHITVKMQDGLSRDMAWLPDVKKVASGTSPFLVEIEKVKTFDDRVLFLEIKSDSIHKLHREIMTNFNLTENELRENFELNLYTPHLTLSIVDGNLTEEMLMKMKMKAEKTFRVPYKFTASFLRVSKENQDGTYSPFEDIPFRK